MLKSQQRFRRKNYNTFTEDVNKSAQLTNDDKRMQSSVSLEHMHMKQMNKSYTE